MTYRRSVLLSALLLSACSLLLRAQQRLNDGLDMRFADGIAAIAEDKVITVEDIRREIGPLVPTLQKEAKNE